MNVLCINGQDHQRSMIVVDHSRKFKDIQSMENPPLMRYNIENQKILFTHHQFQEKRREKNCLNLKKRKVKN